MKTFSWDRWLVLSLMLLLGQPAALAAEREFTLVIQGHRFEPPELVLPAGEKVKLIIENRDPTPEEFDSHALNRERVIPGKSTATLWIGPLSPGRYPFIGEFNDKTAQGVIVVK